MTTKKRVICLAAVALALFGAGMPCFQSVVRAQEAPLVPGSCSPEGAWIMTLLTPQGPQGQTLTVTSRGDTMDPQYTAVLELGEQGNSLLSLLPGFDRQSRFVGQVKKSTGDAWQMTILGYGFKQGVSGSEIQYMSVISSSDLHCSGLNVMAAKINMATFVPGQDADRDGVPDPNERPIVCMTFDALFKQVPMMRPCESTPVTELVYVTVGEEFTVSLASNPTTGFGWTLVSALPYWLEQTDYQFIALPSAPGMTGAGGFEEWTYRPKAVASTILLYEYAQPWAGNVPPAETHSVLVMALEPDTGE